MTDKKLSDNAVHDALHASLEALSNMTGETVHGDAALSTARRALRLTQLAHLTASEKAAGRLDDAVAPTGPAET